MRISERRKAQLIADAIKHQRLPDVDGEDLGEYRYYLNWIKQHLDDPQLTRRFFAEFSALSEEDEHACRLVRNCISDPIEYPTARSTLVNLPDLEWLWKGWLPRRFVSLLAATPGTGKSYLALDLAYRIISATTWPDSQNIPADLTGPVLYVDAENTPIILKKRVGPWSPDVLDSLYLMLPEDEKSMINLDEFSDRDRLWDMAWDIRPRLIIVDSLGSATIRGENNKEDVQLLLSYFNNVAQQLNTTILLVHHLRKTGSQQTTFVPMTLDSIRGSSHIPAMARNVWGLQWIPTDNKTLDHNGPRRLWVMKSNVGLYPEPVGVFFDPHPDNEEVARLRYGDAPQPYRERTKSDDCAEWLVDLLENADGPMAPAEVLEEGSKAGFNDRMIYRVRRGISQIQDTEDNHRHPDNKWYCKDAD